MRDVLFPHAVRGLAVLALIAGLAACGTGTGTTVLPQAADKHIQSGIPWPGGDPTPGTSVMPTPTPAPSASPAPTATPSCVVNKAGNCSDVKGNS